MDENSKLYQVKLKTQCDAAINILMLRDANIQNLYKSFYHDGELDCEGETYKGLHKLRQAYLDLLKGMITINDYDSKDHLTLKNLLNDETLIGSTILDGIDYETREYNYWTSKSSEYSAAAASAEHSTEKAMYASLAGYAASIAVTHKAVLAIWNSKKDFFEDVETQSENLFSVSREYRPKIKEGMNSIVYSFSNGSYSIESNASWQKDIKKLNNKFKDDFLATFHDSDGNIDMEKLADIMSQDPTNITYREYYLLCKEFNKMSNKEKEEFLELGYKGVYQDDPSYDTVKDYGYWTYKIQDTYKIMTVIYESNLTMDPYNITSKDQKLLRNYNLLYTFTNVYDTFSFNGYSNEEEKLGTNKRIEISITKDNDEEYIKANQYPKYITSISYNTMEVTNCYNPQNKVQQHVIGEMTIHPYRSDMFYLLDELHDESVEKLFPDKRKVTVESALTDIGMDLLGEEAKKLYKPVEYLQMMCALICGDEIDPEACKRKSDLQIFDDLESVCEKNYIGGTVLVASNNDVYITQVGYNYTALANSVNEYNMTVPDNLKIDFDPATFFGDYMTDSEYREKFDNYRIWEVNNYKPENDTSNSVNGTGDN